MRGIALKRGIIYGTRDFLRWSSAYPNARLIVIGLLMSAVLPFLLLFWRSHIAEIAIDNYRPTPQGVDLFFPAVAIASLVIVGVHLLGMWIIAFGIIRLAKSHSRNHRVNSPAPNEDGASESN